MWKSNNIRWCIRWTLENDEESNKQRKKTTTTKTSLVSSGGRWGNGKSLSRRKPGQIEMKLQIHNFYCVRHLSVSFSHLFPLAALELSSEGSFFPCLRRWKRGFHSLREPWTHNASALSYVSICRALKRYAIKTNDTIRCYQYRIHNPCENFRRFFDFFLLKQSFFSLVAILKH